MDSPWQLPGMKVPQAPARSPWYWDQESAPYKAEVRVTVSPVSSAIYLLPFGQTDSARSVVAALPAAELELDLPARWLAAIDSPPPAIPQQLWPSPPVAAALPQPASP